MSSICLSKTTLYGQKYKIYDTVVDFIKSNHANILPNLHRIHSLDKPNNLSFWTVDSLTRKHYIIHILYAGSFHLSDREIKIKLSNIGTYVYREIKISLRRSSDFESHFIMLRRKYTISNILINTKYINETLINTANLIIPNKNINLSLIHI
jgi:hypothetical protein